MKTTYKVTLALGVLLPILCLTSSGIAGSSMMLTVATPIASAPLPASVNVAQTPNQTTEQQIENRERSRKGITVDDPRVYDDARLQQMLQAAEARLATLQLIDQSQILAKL